MWQYIVVLFLLVVFAIIPILMGWILVWNVYLTKYKFLREFKVFVCDQFCRMFYPHYLMNQHKSREKLKPPQSFTLYRSGVLSNRKYHAYLDLMKVKKLIQIRNEKRAYVSTQPIVPPENNSLSRDIVSKNSFVLNSTYFAQPHNRAITMYPHQYRATTKTLNVTFDSLKIDDSYM